MKNLYLTLLMVLLGVNFVRGQQSYERVELSAGAGWLSAGLNWSVAGNSEGKAPNVLSEVKWRNLSATGFHAGVQVNLPGGKWFAGGGYQKYIVISGRAEDTDYADDDRRSPSYRADLDADEGSFSSFKLFAGYRLLNSEKLSVAVKAGYTSDVQHFFLLDHKNDVPGQRNLRTLYNTRWKGVLAGLNADYYPTRQLGLSAALLYSQVKYHAEADWNLIDAFKHPVSFRQRANGFILEPSLTLAYKLTEPFALYLQGTYIHAETGTGVDELFLDSGEIRYTRFNGASGGAVSLMLGARFSF